MNPSKLLRQVPPLLLKVPLDVFVFHEELVHGDGADEHHGEINREKGGILGEHRAPQLGGHRALVKDLTDGSVQDVNRKRDGASSTGTTDDATYDDCTELRLYRVRSVHRTCFFFRVSHAPSSNDVFEGLYSWRGRWLLDITRRARSTHVEYVR